MFEKKIEKINDISEQDRIFKFLSKNISPIYYYDKFLETIPEKITFYKTSKTKSDKETQKNREDDETIKKKEIAKKMGLYI